MRKIDNYNKILGTLKDLKIKYPTYNFGRHISLALGDYGDPWTMTDKEFAFALSKYQTELELDQNQIADPLYVDKIVEEALDLDHILDEEDEDE